MDSITSIFNTVPLDWFILAIVAAIIIIDALRSGTTRATAFALALPAAAYLSSLAESTAFIGSIATGGEMASALTFIALIVGVFILAYRGMGYGDGGSPLQSVMAGFGATLIAAAVWANSTALTTLWDFGTSIDSIFGASYALLWIVGGLVLVTLSRR